VVATLELEAVMAPRSGGAATVDPRSRGAATTSSWYRGATTGGSGGRCWGAADLARHKQRIRGGSGYDGGSRGHARDSGPLRRARRRHIRGGSGGSGIPWVRAVTVGSPRRKLWRILEARRRFSGAHSSGGPLGRATTTTPLGVSDRHVFMLLCVHIFVNVNRFLRHTF
jgi:hypothetical protein